MKEKAMNIINNNIELPVLNYEGNQIDTVKLAGSSVLKLMKMLFN